MLPPNNTPSALSSGIDSSSASLPAGHGILKVTTIDPPPSSTQSEASKRTQISFPIVRFSYPLKLIVSRSYYNTLDQLQIGLVYLLNYGGGLVSGDHLSIDIYLSHKCHLLCLSQGSTKVYKDKAVHHSYSKPSQSPHVLYPNGPPGPSTILSKHQTTRQNINARIGSNATLLMLPSYVTCFRDSSFIQKQTYHLEDETSSLICLDWFTSGRTHSTRIKNQDTQKLEIESWTFKKFQSFIEIFLSSKRLIRDNLLLLNQQHDDNNNNNNNNTRGDFFNSLQLQNNFTVFANLFIVCSSENPKLIQVFNRLKRLDLANKTQPHQRPSQNNKNQILWCFSELNVPKTTQNDSHDNNQQYMNQNHTTTVNDHDPKNQAFTRIGIARIGSQSTILVRNWLEKNLVDLVDFIGPEFYHNCF